MWCRYGILPPRRKPACPAAIYTLRGATFQDERFYRLLDEAFIESHECCTVDCRIRGQVRLSPEICRCLLDVRITLGHAIESGQFRKETDAGILLQSFEDLPDLTVSERIALHRGGIGEVAQKAELSQTREADGIGLILIPPGCSRTAETMALNYDREPNVDIRKTGQHRSRLRWG